MFTQIVNAMSVWAIPIMIVGFVGYGLIKKVNVYECFTEGAKEGFQTGVRIIPFLVAILCAIGVFRASGAMDMLTKVLSPITNLIGMPGEVLPMAFMRPMSGSGARGVMTELVTTHGPHSLIGRMAAVMNGSTDTTFYVLAVYFGSVQVKKSRHALPAGLLADLAGVLAAAWVTRLFFG